MNYPPPNKIRSPNELKELYNKARQEVSDLKKITRLERSASRQSRDEAIEAEKRAKKLSKDLFTMTKKQKAAQEASKCGYWSGAATVCVTMLYEAWRIVGFPGGREWAGWWEHEALYGAICWATTMTFASFYRATQGD
tara:strand:- start:12012 stop:12425 length:414 start_codon:yes stop_codon:yes gene_type:complete